MRTHICKCESKMAVMGDEVAAVVVGVISGVVAGTILQ